MQQGHKEHNRGMITTVLNHLKKGYEITGMQAAKDWETLNIRNQISTLRSEGWPIRSRFEHPKQGSKYKVYFLDMDKEYWPKDNEA